MKAGVLRSKPSADASEYLCLPMEEDDDERPMALRRGDEFQEPTTTRERHTPHRGSHFDLARGCATYFGMLPSIRGLYEVISSAALKELTRTEKAVLFGICVPPWRRPGADIQRSSDAP